MSGGVGRQSRESHENEELNPTLPLVTAMLTRVANPNFRYQGL